MGNPEEPGSANRCLPAEGQRNPLGRASRPTIGSGQCYPEETIQALSGFPARADLSVDVCFPFQVR